MERFGVLGIGLLNVSGRVGSSGIEGPAFSDGPVGDMSATQIVTVATGIRVRRWNISTYPKWSV